MTREASARLGHYIAGAGVLVALVAYAVAGVHAAFSAAVGAIVAVANFHVWRWLVGRIVDQRMTSKPALGLLLVSKMVAGLGAVFLLLLLGLVAPLPFIAGLGSLVIGMLFGSAIQVASGTALEGEGG